MKKRKLKKKKRKLLKLLLIAGIILIILLFPIMTKKENKVIKTNTKEKLINTIAKQLENENITKEFLTWIENTYGEKSLKELNKRLKEEEYKLNIWHDITGNSYIVLNDLYNKAYDNRKDIKIMETVKDNTISFVGDVSLADNWYIMPKYDERKKGVYGILSESIVDIMKKSTVMVANSEFTVSDRGEKMPGKYYTFRGSPKRLPIYNEMGVDLVTLANNHVYDFGRTAFYDMIDSLNEYKIPYIGAGKNIEEAKRPYYFIINGYKVAFINATRAEKIILTPEATETEGGVFRCYDPTNFMNVIKETKEKSDYVVALIHWGREDSHGLEDVQIETSKYYIDAGADVIVGSHAHVLQGIEFYKNKPIIYNLGDFIFNNEKKDTGIFQININKLESPEYYFYPAYESNEYTELLTGNEKQRVINNMNTWSSNATINEEGKITEN